LFSWIEVLIRSNVLVIYGIGYGLNGPIFFERKPDLAKRSGSEIEILNKST